MCKVYLLLMTTQLDALSLQIGFTFLGIFLPFYFHSNRSNSFANFDLFILHPLRIIVRLTTLPATNQYLHHAINQYKMHIKYFIADRVCENSVRTVSQVDQVNLKCTYYLKIKKYSQAVDRWCLVRRPLFGLNRLSRRLADVS